MKRYKLYGLIIESDIEFMQLVQAENADIWENDVVTVKNGNIANEVNNKLQGKTVNYNVEFDVSCFRNRFGYYLVRNGNEILYEPKEEPLNDMIKSFILGYCISLVLLQRKILAIHCSAVCLPDGENDDGAILISGTTGAGKSSVTRKLLESGYRFMADDVAAIRYEEKALVYPAFPYQKLCRNEVVKRDLKADELIYVGEDKDKFFVPVKGMFEGNPKALKCMIFLSVSDDSAVNIKKLKGIEQLFAFKRNLFLFMFGGDWQNTPSFMELCLKIVGECPIYVISRPREKDTLEDIARIIKEITD